MEGLFGIGLTIVCYLVLECTRASTSESSTYSEAILLLDLLKFGYLCPMEIFLGIARFLKARFLDGLIF